MKFESNIRADITENVESETRRLFQQTTVYINAGGRGTRLESILPKRENGIAKAMIAFNGKPMIENHTDVLSQLGFKNIIVGAGDHVEVEQHYQGKESENLDIVTTEIQEDTGGDLIKAIRQTENTGKNILVENVDTLVYIDNLAKLLAEHEKSGATATIVLTTKTGVPNEGAFFVDEDGKVVFSHEARANFGLVEPQDWSGLKASSTGVVIFKTDFLKTHSWQPGQTPLSIYRDLLPELIRKGELFAYNNEDNLFVDTGTPEKYHQVKRHEKRLFGALGKKYVDQIEE